MTAPAFWQTGGPLAAALSPLTLITRMATARRVARPGWQAPVPVICCGNPSVGGAGKTPLCLDILARLHARGINAHGLTRGHGGRLHGPARVDPARHTAADVGDEALLLAAAAPTWVGADRAEAAREAVAAGAQALVMDDGLQHPSLVKTMSFLVIDGGAGFGNGRLLPAGPLREPVQAAAARCHAAVIVGADQTGALGQLPPSLPVLHAAMAPGPGMLAMAGRDVVAFAGIGRPEKFFATLRAAGLRLAASASFADHHTYTDRDLARLLALAHTHQAALVTTTKDYARLTPAARAGITPLAAALHWADAASFERVLAAIRY